MQGRVLNNLIGEEKVVHIDATGDVNAAKNIRRQQLMSTKLDPTVLNLEGLASGEKGRAKESFSALTVVQAATKGAISATSVSAALRSDRLMP